MLNSERRSEARVDNKLKVWVQDKEAETSNVSLAGMQVAFPSLSVAGGQQVDIDADYLLTTVTLPNEEQVRANCRMTYISDDGAQLLAGLEIASFQDNDFVLWAQYVNKLLYP